MSTFFAVLGALIVWSIIMELYHLSLSFYRVKKEQEYTQELQNKINSGDTGGLSLIDSYTGMPLDLSHIFSAAGKNIETTVSGGGKGTGQYL